MWTLLSSGHANGYTEGRTHTHAHTPHTTHHTRITISLSPLSQTLDEMRLEPKPIQIDRRLTGSNYIDEPLQQVSNRWMKDGQMKTNGEGAQCWHTDTFCLLGSVYTTMIEAKSPVLVCNYLNVDIYVSVAKGCVCISDCLSRCLCMCLSVEHNRHIPSVSPREW